MDLHKDKVDKIKIKCKKCGKEILRIPEVIDCWVESASMPFAELHFPFENKEQFKKRLPAQYIAEYIAQTRTWFYYLHVLSVLLFRDISFENVVTTGTILNDKGEKLSNSKMNYPDPWKIIDQYGADALRFYLMSASVMQAEDLFFNERDVREAYNKVINTVCNVAEFYAVYAGKNPKSEIRNPKFILDRWILSRLNSFVLGITESMNKYDTIKSSRLIKEFIEELSLWYVRRSRERFKEEGENKLQAEATLRQILSVFSKCIAPLLPFTAEFIYKKIGRVEAKSVHLLEWPKAEKKYIDKNLEEKMDLVRKMVSFALAERVKNGIKVRQPLALLKIKDEKSKIKGNADLLDLIKDEVNVKEIIFNKNISGEVELDINITAELKEEGILRDMLMLVQDARNEQKLAPQDLIYVEVLAPEKEKSIVEKNKSDLLKEFRAKEIKIQDAEKIEIKIQKA